MRFLPCLKSWASQITSEGSCFAEAAQGRRLCFCRVALPLLGSLTRFVPQPQTPPGLTTSPQASLPACPAVGLSTSKILSDGSGDIEPPRRRAILPRPEGQGLTRHLVRSSSTCTLIPKGDTISTHLARIAKDLHSRPGQPAQRAAVRNTFRPTISTPICASATIVCSSRAICLRASTPFVLHAPTSRWSK
jgi:hypothetical protein